MHAGKLEPDHNFVRLKIDAALLQKLKRSSARLGSPKVHVSCSESYEWSLEDDAVLLFD